LKPEPVLHSPFARLAAWKVKKHDGLNRLYSRRVQWPAFIRFARP
jgi:hypothetical protein